MLRPWIEGVDAAPAAQCNHFHHIPNLSYVDICAFINSTAACKPDDGFIDYLHFIYCSLAGKWRLIVAAGAADYGSSVYGQTMKPAKWMLACN